MSNPALAGVLPADVYETTLPTPFSSCHEPLMFHTATRRNLQYEEYKVSYVDGCLLKRLCTPHGSRWMYLRRGR